ncbi:MAG: hypothetical protein CM15mP120_23020 [Pseudomonadota bacterium]|nr:MAG: hypothetical protein CM15mP120_23020 [Pseudomonadota bacterium]
MKGILAPSRGGGEKGDYFIPKRRYSFWTDFEFLKGQGGYAKFLGLYPCVRPLSLLMDISMIIIVEW